ncbi:MAG: hypothetical protein ABEJ87_05935 [Candidatus Nanohalobium sp.]
MFGSGNNGKSNEEVIREMERQAERTGTPVITEISQEVTVYDFSVQDEETGSDLFGDSSENGRIDDIEGRVDHYMDQGMDVMDAAEATYADINAAYDGGSVKVEDIRTAVQELETYVENKGGDLQAAKASTTTEIDDALERISNASETINDVYDDLLG